jgi:protein-disulfide isomerase
VKDYQGKVRVVYKNMVVHPQIVMKGHLGGCAASKQGKFVEYRHEWWEKAFAPYAAARDPSKLGEDTIMAIAKDLKLDEAKFKADMNGPECQAQVNTDMQELSKWHVNATPSFFINGRVFSWTGSPDSFKSAVDDELKKVEGSGVACADYYQKQVMDKGEKEFKAKKSGGAKQD